MSNKYTTDTTQAHVIRQLPYDIDAAEHNHHVNTTESRDTRSGSLAADESPVMSRSNQLDVAEHSTNACVAHANGTDR